jgi:hypothetical protein
MLPSAVLHTRPAPACKANALLLSFNLTQQQQQQQQQRDNQAELPEVQLSVPLHAKYPEPHAFGFQGWRALSSGRCSNAARLVPVVTCLHCISPCS